LNCKSERGLGSVFLPGYRLAGGVGQIEEPVAPIVRAGRRTSLSGPGGGLTGREPRECLRHVKRGVGAKFIQGREQRRGHGRRTREQNPT